MGVTDISRSSQTDVVVKSYMGITAGDVGLTESLLAEEVNGTVVCNPRPWGFCAEGCIDSNLYTEQNLGIGDAGSCFGPRFTSHKKGQTAF